MDSFRRKGGRSLKDDRVFVLDTSPSDSSYLAEPANPVRSRPILRRRASFPPLKSRSKVRSESRHCCSSWKARGWLTSLLGCQKMDSWVADPPSNVGPRAMHDSSDELARPASTDGYYPVDYEYEKDPFPRRHARVYIRDAARHRPLAEWPYEKRRRTPDVLEGKKYTYAHDYSKEYAREHPHQSSKDYRHAVRFSRRPTPPPPSPRPSSRSKSVRRHAATDMIMSIYEVLRSDGLAEREITDFFKDAIIEARRKHR
jgi:hypothetical protein